MKITARQREILIYIQENGHAPYDANAAIRNRMENTMGLYRSQKNADGAWVDVLTEEGLAAI